MRRDEKDEEETGPFRRAEHFRRLREERDDAVESTRRLQVRAVRRASLGAAPVPGAANWLPIGPGLVANGQAATRPSVSGRLTVVEVTETGRVYVGAANGGVWRSDDRGHTWTPMMDGVNRKTLTNQTDSLSIGALAVPQQDPNRIYAGTGEGGMGVDGFFGVGPLRSDDGGRTWTAETWPGAQSAFYQLVVDPSDPERALGATTQGPLLRLPRNHYTQGLPWPRPTSYRYRYDVASGDIEAQYWDADGRNTVEVARAAWPLDLRLQSLTLNSSPFLLVYRVDNAHVGGPPMAPGNAQVVPIPHDGGLPALGAGTPWGQNLLVFDFSLDGEHYLCRYDNALANGPAQLARLAQPFTGAFADVGAALAWQRWGQVMPLVLHGAPYVLFYQDLTAGVARRARLMRWTPQLDLVQVWQADDTFAAAQVLVPVVLGSEQTLLQYDPTNGNVALFRFRLNGEPHRIWRAAARLLPQAVLESFDFLDRQEGGYRRHSLLQATAADGTTALYDWKSKLTLLWKRQGPPRSHTPFDIGYEWVNLLGRLNPGPPSTVVTSVAITRRGNQVRYYAAVQADPASLVYVSEDSGVTWNQLGQLVVAGRLSLAVQPGNPDLLYLFSQDSSLYRLNLRDDRGWRRVHRTPPNPVLAQTQGWYDLAIAVAPEDPDTVFVGGQSVWAVSPRGSTWSAAIYRCRISEQNGELVASPVYIGASVHADVHGFAFTPGRPNELWVVCDGGLFFTDDAARPATGDVTHLFESRNAGLSTMTVNRSMKWGDEDAIVFTTNQDNGLQLGRAGLFWEAATGGDGGSSVRNGNDVLMTFEKLKLGRSTQRGLPNTFQPLEGLQRLIDAFGELLLFYPPLAQLAGTASVVAGTVRPWISHDLGLTWSVIPTIGLAAPPAQGVPYPPIGGAQPPPPAENLFENQIIAMVWANANRFYAGTMGGEVRRYDLAAGQWAATNYPMPVPRPVTSLTLGANADTVLVTVGGGPGPRLYSLSTAAPPPGVWLGLQGAPGRALPDLQMNTLAHGGPNELFIGSDIGIWRSPDDGANWDPWSQGLPESAVLDLQYFPALAGARTRPALLRASTHGRGVWDRAIVPNARDVALLLRVNPLDTGLEDRRTALDPIDGTAHTIRDGACIKPTQPYPDGRWPHPASIHWNDFPGIPDQSRHLVSGRPVRLYIEVNNRGIGETNAAYLTLFVSHAYAPLAPPPADLMAWPDPQGMRPEYWVRVHRQQLVTDARYDIPAFVGVPAVTAERPQVVSVDLPGTSFPGPGFYCIVVVISAPEDEFDSQVRDIDALVTADRHVASKFLAVR